MKLESDGILISMRPLNERDSLAHIFTHDFGVMCGVLRGAVVARQNKPLVGQVGAMSWNARLDSQVGTFHWDAMRNAAATLMLSRQNLAYMNCVFDLIDALLPEREQYAQLYSETIDVLDKLANGAGQIAYQQWEINLLRELGYALDLSRCSGCGTHENLNFLSPRTGRAVCDDCAAPYINKLYKLPVGLEMTLRFLERVCDSLGIQVPRSRRVLQNSIY